VLSIKKINPHHVALPRGYAARLSNIQIMSSATKAMNYDQIFPYAFFHEMPETP